MSKLLNTLPEKGYDKRELSREEVGPNPEPNPNPNPHPNPDPNPNPNPNPHPHPTPTPKQRGSPSTVASGRTRASCR